MALPRIPGWFDPPPPSAPCVVEAGLGQAEQRQGHQLDLEGPRHWLFRPHSAFLCPEALFIVTHGVFLSEAYSKSLYHLRMPGQVQPARLPWGSASLSKFCKFLAKKVLCNLFSFGYLMLLSQIETPAIPSVSSPTSRNDGWRPATNV